MQRIQSKVALFAAVVGGAVLVARASLAQEPEEPAPMPAEPAPMPVEPAPMPAEAQPLESTGVGPGEVLFEAQPSPDQPTGDAAAENLDAYTIQSGDTLWDICARLLGDPFYWPKLWSLNQYITNPHWIYPGNLLVFREGTETAPPQFEVTKPEAVALEPTPAMVEPVAMTEPVPIEPAPVPVAPVTAETLQEGFQIPTEAEPPVAAVAVADPFALTPIEEVARSYQINLRQEGFISEGQISPLGFVYKSEEEKNNLAETDEVYIRLSDPSQAQVGKKFTVFRTLRRVKHPQTRGYMGFLVKILAELQIQSVSGEIANAKVLTSYDYINRGDPITDYVDILKRVDLVPNSANLEGVIVESMVEGLSIMGNGDVIYIDKGTADGLSIGNTVDVVRSGDGLIDRGEDRDKMLPTEVVGRLVIVGAQERTATAVIVDSYDALVVGDKVRVAPN